MHRNARLNLRQWLSDNDAPMTQTCPCVIDIALRENPSMTHASMAAFHWRPIDASATNGGISRTIRAHAH